MRAARTSLVCLCALAGAALLALAASGCAEPSSAADPNPTPVAGGTYVVPLQWEPPGIEPASVYDSESWQVNHQVFQGLVRWETGSDGIMRGVPCLAESWSANDDATVWTFHLRKGVRFQPPVGREVTAQDVVDDWRYVADPANGSFVAYLLSSIKGSDAVGYAAKGLTGVKALDRYTLRVALKYPFADFPLLLGNPATGVWPVDYMKRVSRKAFRNKPVGTGPYMVDRWVHDKYVDLVKNPDYWDAANAGHVERIHLPIMDTEDAVAGVPEGGHRHRRCAGRPDRRGPGPCRGAGRPLAGEVLALAGRDHGRDRSEEPASGRRGEPPAPPGPELCRRSSRAAGRAGRRRRAAGGRRAGDRARAGRHRPRRCRRPRLSATTPRRRDGSSTRSRPCPPSSTSPGGPWPKSTSGLAILDRPLLAGWRSAGLDVARKGYEWNSYIRKVSLGTEGDFFVTGWLADYPSPDDFLYLLFHSGDSGARSIATFYKNPDVDRLLEEARGTLDESRRLELYAQAERQILSDAPVIPLYFCRCFRVANARVQGQAVDPMGAIDMWKVWVK